tara:strand:- start:977 stop:1381 length:405 start_codon:yes stop_codon:yes gene_type:complete
MADAVTSQTLFDGDKHVVMKFTNISDGTGESAVKKVDVSALNSDIYGNTCSSVAIEKIWWQCIGMKVRLFFDASSDKFIIELGENQSGFHDYSEFGGITNNAAASGKTGDIDFTTIGHSSADTYTIILKMRKTY